MISEAAAYVASRVTEGAAERFGRKIAWGAAIAVLSAGALAFALVAAYHYLVPLYGDLEAAAIIAGGCLFLASLLIVVPWLYRKTSRAMQSSDAPQGAQAFAKVDEEAREAIDYFGAAKIMATAFMFGFSAARRIKA